MCGIATIPIGCIAGGIICGIPIVSLLMIMLPLVVFSGIIVFGLIKFPEMCIKIFKVFGVFITVLITVGLTLGIIRFLSGIEVIKGLATIEEGASICVNAAIVLSGSFPFMYVLTKVLSKPFKIVSKKMGINEYSVSGFIASLASNATTFGMMDKMDRKGVVLNAAFSVSAAFSLGSHLAFTMAFDEAYVVPVIAGKLISGVLALVLGSIIFNKTEKE